MGAILHTPPLRWGFLGGVVLLLLGSVSLVYFQFVKVKMLPFDNKSEFQVIVDMPNGTTLEQTARVDRRAGAQRRSSSREVVNLQTYVGTASPFNFNGLVRHYYLRRGSNVADIQVNLLGKERSQTAKPRDRQTGAPAAAARRQPLRRAHQGGGSAARAAGAGDAGGGGLRARAGRAHRASPGRFAICGSAPTAWWMSTGMWKTISRSTA